jgi:hypothetical protein
MTVDGRRARDTILMLAERPVERVYSGHGPPMDAASSRLRALADQLAPDRSPP